MDSEILLRIPTDKEFDVWFEDSCREFSEDTAFIEGTKPEDEYKKIIEKSKEILSEGKNSEGSIIKVFDHNDDANCGFVWFGKLPALKDDQIFLYQITIAKDQRGKGLGRKLLSLMHEKLKKMGYNSVYLNVMKRNYAKDLYISLGYEIAQDSEHNMILVKQI